ncbi:unnamed protein product [Sphagnum balticum]
MMKNSLDLDLVVHVPECCPLKSNADERCITLQIVLLCIGLSSQLLANGYRSLDLANPLLFLVLELVFGNPAEGLVCGDCGNSYLIDAENPEIIDGKGVLGRKAVQLWQKLTPSSSGSIDPPGGWLPMGIGQEVVGLVLISDLSVF